MTEANNIAYDVADALMERPIGFSLSGQHFCLYPLTIGHIQLITRLAETMGLGAGTDSRKVLGNIAKSSKKDSDTCLRIIAYASLKGSECLDETKVSKRIRQLRKLDAEDLATMVTMVLTADKSESIMKHFHMDTEKKRMEQAMKAKDKSSGTLTFGGKSIWGTLIDFACERYGWTLEYVVWGISYCNLQLLMADHVKTLFLTEKEAKSAHISTDGVVVDTKDTETLRNIINNTSWR